MYKCYIPGVPDSVSPCKIVSAASWPWLSRETHPKLAESSRESQNRSDDIRTAGASGGARSENNARILKRIRFEFRANLNVNKARRRWKRARSALICLHSSSSLAWSCLLESRASLVTWVRRVRTARLQSGPKRPIVTDDLTNHVLIMSILLLI